MYNFYCYYKDLRIGKYKCQGDNIEELYSRMSKPIIMDGFKNGKDWKLQVKVFQLYCDGIAKQVDRCEKVRASDFLMFLSCYIALVKYNKIPDTDYLFMKIK